MVFYKQTIRLRSKCLQMQKMRHIGLGGILIFRLKGKKYFKKSRFLRFSQQQHLGLLFDHSGYHFFLFDYSLVEHKVPWISYSRSFVPTRFNSNTWFWDGFGISITGPVRTGRPIQDKITFKGYPTYGYGYPCNVAGSSFFILSPTEHGIYDEKVINLDMTNGYLLLMEKSMGELNCHWSLQPIPKPNGNIQLSIKFLFPNGTIRPAVQSGKRD